MSLQFLFKKKITYFFYILSIFIIDRITKLYVINLSDKYSESELFNSLYLNIFLIWNKGIAFGLLSFDQNYLYNFITVFILIIILILIVLVFAISKRENLEEFNNSLSNISNIDNLK